ncbi:signal peptidase II [Lacinutrix sp. C3R15]|uniref:signal peptidase II n=1 Tax=Flavobacteriaceae TaxID=49546 RepID=UPI001C088CAA|nr:MULTISPECIES: signal peptidase II [Flavobacteriaceae]MBU2940006.1 signal peptidase II [Lacinutrix sp. C3R15]MDO6623323.1 signal peptidase II [Oceanihabitans sp. 1_MG-2023]
MKRSLFITFLIIFNIVIDQLSKIWTRENVTRGSKSEIIGDYFTLHNVENSGAFLGMGSDLSPTMRAIFLLIIPISVMAYVLFLIFKNKNLDTFSLIGFCCILGGGIANIYDRFIYGSVTDMFHIDLGGVFRTGIFNVADMSVMLGLGLLIIGNFKKKEV